MATVSYKTLLNGIKYWAERTFLRKDDEGIEAVKSDVEVIKDEFDNLTSGELVDGLNPSTHYLAEVDGQMKRVSAKDANCFILNCNDATYVEFDMGDSGPYGLCTVGFPSTIMHELIEADRAGKRIDLVEYYEDYDEYYHYGISDLYAYEWNGIIYADIEYYDFGGFHYISAFSCDSLDEWDEEVGWARCTTPALFNQYCKTYIGYNGPFLCFAFLRKVGAMQNIITFDGNNNLIFTNKKTHAWGYILDNFVCSGVLTIGNVVIVRVTNAGNNTYELGYLKGDGSFGKFIADGIQPDVTPYLHPEYATRPASASARSTNRGITHGRMKKLKAMGEWTPDLEAQWQAQEAERRANMPSENQSNADVPSIEPAPLEGTPVETFDWLLD